MNPSPMTPKPDSQITPEPVVDPGHARTTEKHGLTPWFPSHVDPVRVGVYEIQGTSYDAPNYRRWQGDGWSGTWSRPDGSIQNDRGVLYSRGEDMTGWRGVTLESFAMNGLAGANEPNKQQG